MLKFRKSLKKLERLDNRESRSNYILNLDRNENLRGFNVKEKKKLFQLLLNTELNHYPNLDNVYKKLSNYLNIKPEKILICEGVSGGIKNILDSLELNRHSEIIVPKPSFALYEIYGRIYGLKIKTFNYDRNYKLDHLKILKIVSKNTVAVFMPLPNIPIEGDISKKIIFKIAKKLSRRNILLAIDEVYYPFGNITFVNLINHFKNVVVMRSFSKAFGLAGARIGFILSSKENIKIFNNTKGGYETNILSAVSLEFVLDNSYILKNYLKKTKLGMDYLKNKLDYLNINYFGGKNGNYIFIQFKNSKIAKRVYEKLKFNKIATRYGYKKPFNSGILVTGGPKKDMEIFFNIFSKSCL